MIETYIESGDMFVLIDEGVKAECVVTREGPGVYEIKNIATSPAFQKQGYARRLIDYLYTYYKDCQIIYVGIKIARSPSNFTKAAAFTNPIG